MIYIIYFWANILSFFQTENTNTNFTIKIAPQLANEALQLSKKKYCLNSKDSFNITELKMYVGNFQLHNDENKSQFIDTNYFLLNAEKGTSLNLNFKNCTVSKITSIDFLVGVDSIENTKGALAGDLDAINGMYWTWNSGFINFKIEGTSSSCKTIHHVFDFHIGGFIHPNSTIQKVHLQLKSPVDLIHKNELELLLNLNEVLGNIDFSTTNHIVEPGKNAVDFSKQFQNMFSEK